MDAQKHLEALADTAARLQALGVQILEARYDHPESWCMAVKKGQTKLEVFWQGNADSTLAISRLRLSDLGVAYWDKPELLTIPDDQHALSRVVLRAEREIVARIQNA